MGLFKSEKDARVSSLLYSYPCTMISKDQLPGPARATLISAAPLTLFTFHDLTFGLNIKKKLYLKCYNNLRRVIFSLILIHIETFSSVHLSILFKWTLCNGQYSLSFTTKNVLSECSPTCGVYLNACGGQMKRSFSG